MFLRRNCRAASRICKIRPNMVFPPIFFFFLGGGGGGGREMRRSEHAHASYPGLSFARPGSVPIRGGKKGEVGDWTTPSPVLNTNISLDSLLHSNTFGKTYRKFMIPIYKLMRGNLDTKLTKIDFKGYSIQWNS